MSCRPPPDLHWHDRRATSAWRNLRQLVEFAGFSPTRNGFGPGPDAAGRCHSGKRSKRFDRRSKCFRNHFERFRKRSDRFAKHPERFPKRSKRFANRLKRFRKPPDRFPKRPK